MSKVNDEKLNTLAKKMYDLTYYHALREELVFYPYILKIATHNTTVRLGNKERLALYRRWKKLILESGLFYIVKMDGMVTAILAPHPPPHQREGCLLDKGDECPPCKTQTYPPQGGVRPLREYAIKRLSEVKTLSHEDGNYISKLFTAYLEYINDKKIVLVKDEKSEAIMFNYATRFNSEKKKLLALHKYDSAWKKAEKLYKTAVFITLTTNPHNFEALSIANRHISEAWNTFMTWVRKRLGFRPRYIRILEFTKTGLAHIHAVLFGISRLADIREISREWEKIGQGKIVYAYKIVNRNGRWIWEKARPHGAKNK